MTDTRVESDNYFAIIPEWILYEVTLSANAIRLYCTLNRFANSSGRAWPSRRTIAALMAVSVETVDRAKKELVDFGAITVTNRTSAAGDPTSNVYTIRTSHPSSPVARGGGKDDPTRTLTRDALNRDRMKQSQKTTSVFCGDCHSSGWLAETVNDELVAVRCKCSQTV